MCSIDKFQLTLLFGLHPQVNHACILYKENKFEESRQKFQTAMQAQGYSAQLCYAAALCCYRLKQYQQVALFKSMDKFYTKQ